MPFLRAVAPVAPPPRESREGSKVSRAIVVGAGFGGMAAALRLRARGYDVELVDRL